MLFALLGRKPSQNKSVVQICTGNLVKRKSRFGKRGPTLDRKTLQNTCFDKVDRIWIENHHRTNVFFHIMKRTKHTKRVGDCPLRINVSSGALVISVASGCPPRITASSGALVCSSANGCHQRVVRISGRCGRNPVCGNILDLCGGQEQKQLIARSSLSAS